VNHRLLIFVAVSALLPLAACSRSGEESGTTVEAVDVSMGMPVTTSSEDAKSHFLLGLHALDMTRPDDARPHFEQAVAADPDFAIGYLLLANASNSLAEFQRNLALAGEHAASASEAERLVIEIAQKDFDDDVEGELAAARRLVEVIPESPRAWMELATVQSGNGDEQGARESLQRATQAAPDFAPAYMALAISYTVEPRDLAQAQTAAARAVELEPDEAVTHDLLGDALRVQGQLEEAAQEYTRTAELDPETGNGFQQRGHVHTFLGNYDQARADYDSAIEIEQGKNSAAAFRVYRALVSVHEGNPTAAVDELGRLAMEIDGMGIPEPLGQKIFTQFTIFDIAVHAGLMAQAETARGELDVFLDEQTARVGTEAARRNTAATKAILDGRLAAANGDFATATAKANEAMTIMEPSADPQKNEPAHALLGLVALKQANFGEAATHFEQADPDDIYVTFLHAQALEGAGDAEGAGAGYQKVANFYFNSPGLALVRKDAIAAAQ
jgi:tetratricopeptide (TPR) repeat protein